MSEPRPAPVVEVRWGVLIVALGGALGAAVRGILLQEWPTHADAFPWTVFAINVSGCLLLAALPASALVRRVPWLPLFLGTGVMGGYTTMSTAAVESYDLRTHAAVALSYLIGTLAAAVAAVMLVNRMTTPDARALIAAEEGDE